MKIDIYLKQMLNKGASDLYFKVASPPCFRINDQLVLDPGKKVEPPDVDTILDSILTDDQKKHFLLTKELDAAYSVSGLGRFRFNVYFQRGTKAITFRSIKIDIPSFAGLNLPVDVMEQLASQRRGLILVTGYAGSGKSTTIASMIDYINSNFEKHIITIEDPIEFVHTDKKSIVSQREVGSDTADFSSALRHVIRQSPDVIVIGEMRDIATMQTAIMAAETGHLVLSTLHTVDAAQTVERIVNFFPVYTHNQIKLQLSQLLKGVVSMRLVPRSDKLGMVPACEVLLATPTIKKYIMDGKTDKLLSLIEEGRLFGMRSFNQALLEWLSKTVISKESALSYASNADELALKLKDILSGGSNYL